MLQQDTQVGDYVELYPRKIDNYSRQRMVLLIEELYELKGYKLETLYQAVGLADRYLSKTLA